jgi:hypothetical protein
MNVTLYFNTPSPTTFNIISLCALQFGPSIVNYSTLILNGSAVQQATGIFYSLEGNFTIQNSQLTTNFTTQSNTSEVAGLFFSADISKIIQNFTNSSVNITISTNGVYGAGLIAIVNVPYLNIFMQNTSFTSDINS